MPFKNLQSIRKKIASENLSESDILIAWAIKKDRAFVLAHPEYRPTPWQRFKIFYYLKKLKQDIPVAYIIGKKEFHGLNFKVNSNTLIPRPETELLADEALKHLETGHVDLFIDVGTGSGCIPIAVIHQYRNISIMKHKLIKIIATDISHPALRVAKNNAKHHNVEIQFLHGDLLEPLTKLPESVIITANLPYLTEKQFKNEPSIKKEPKTALVSDSFDGLNLYNKLFNQIKEFKIKNWTLISEIDPTQSKKMIKAVKKIFPQGNIIIKKDLAGLDRVAVINSH